MKKWVKLSLLLCVFGMVKELRPSEPYVTHYLVGQWKNFTDEQVYEEMFPVGTYSQLVELIAVFLVTDLLRYKPIIILEGLAGIITWSVLTWGSTMLEMKVVQVFYGLFCATEVAYYTYIYAQVDRRHYQKVTSHTRTAYLIGRFMSGVLSQILVSTQAMDYHQLNYITFGAMIFATLWAISLPPAKHSIYFHREDNNNATLVHLDVEKHDDESLNEEELKFTVSGENSSDAGKSYCARISKKWATAYKYLWRDFVDAFTRWYVVKWSIWWSLATCGYLQGLSYVQLLWEAILKDTGQTNDNLFNGAVEALYTILGALAALGCGWLTINWRRAGEAALALASVIVCAVLIVSATCNSMIVAYACHIIFGILFNTMITIANAEVAKSIREDSFGLIFGINTFIALVLQTILTAVVVDGRGLALNIRYQFLVYGGYFGVLGLTFSVMAAYSLCCKKWDSSEKWIL